MKSRWVKDKHVVKTEYRDVWNVESTLSPIVLSLIKTLKEKRHGYPARLENGEEWDSILDEGITLFEKLVDNDDNWSESYFIDLDAAYDWLKNYLPDMWD